MKKAFLILLLMAAVSVNSYAVYRLFDDFEDELTSPIDEQDSWQSGGGDNRVVADPADPSNQVLYVPSESSIIKKSLLTENTEYPTAPQECYL